MYDNIKIKMLETLPKNQLNFAEFAETDKLIILDFISRNGRLMCTLYNKKTDEISTFPVA